MDPKRFANAERRNEQELRRKYDEKNDREIRTADERPEPLDHMATARPWSASKFSDTKSTTIYGPDGSPSIGSIKNPEDAELVIRAVNSHDDLLIHLKLLATWMRRTSVMNRIGAVGQMLDAADAAIAKATP